METTIKETEQIVLEFFHKRLLIMVFLNFRKHIFFRKLRMKKLRIYWQVAWEGVFQ